MLKYIIKKLILMIPVLIGMTIVIFLILHLAPGDPVHLLVGPNVTPEAYEQVRLNLGLDKSVASQYFTFMGNILTGDLGTSILQKRPVSEIIIERLPITLEIGFYALILSFLISLPLGIAAAIKRNTAVDYGAMTAALIGMSLPNFWFGLLLIYFFSYKLGWFPISGYGTWMHLVLPVIAIGLTDAAITARMARSSMLEVIRQDYIRTARSKGLKERVVMNEHALRNALIPLITILGLRIGMIFSGSVIIETVFSIPGIGRTMVDAIFARDFPVIQGSLLVLGACVLIGNLIADILYAVVDPRIKY